MNKVETKETIKKWLLGWIGNKPTHIITQTALKWFELGLFTEEDVAEIDVAIEGENAEVVE